jgi:hypothetical protein
MLHLTAVILFCDRKNYETLNYIILPTLSLTSPVLGSSVFTLVPFSTPPISVLLTKRQTNFHIHIKLQVITVLYILILIFLGG